MVILQLPEIAGRKHVDINVSEAYEVVIGVSWSPLGSVSDTTPEDLR